ncbi:MAG TPA: hypothetical protein VIK01_20650, partial [Polyangiaceae bacterium]
MTTLQETSEQLSRSAHGSRFTGDRIALASMLLGSLERLDRDDGGHRHLDMLSLRAEPSRRDGTPL